MRRILAAGMLASAIVSPVRAEPAALRFGVDVAPHASRYLRLLEHPPYLAAALENAGVRPSNAARITFVDGRTLRFRNAELAFEGVEDTRYRYRVRLQWNAGVGDVSYDLPVTVDAQRAAEGHVELVVQHPGGGLLPESLADRIGLKLQALAAPAAQAAALRYLEGLPDARGPDPRPALERILIDSYNLPGAAGGSCNREPGDAERLQDMGYFFATLVIWMIGMPALFFWARRRRVRRMVGG